MYTSYFGLQEKPFNLTPDERFFYSNPAYEEAYARLQYGIQERKGLIIITGEAGCGKTLLLRHVVHKLASQVRFISLDNIFLTFEDLLDTLCTELEVDVGGSRMLQKFEKLKMALISQLEHEKTVALLIDEAHRASVEMLENIRLLSNLETAQEKLLQIVLVGQPELEDKIDHHQLRQLKQRVVVQYRLSCLQAKEVKAYINHRLHIADYTGRELFSAQALARISAYSHGIPRIINIICDNAMLSAYAFSHQTITPAIIEEVAAELRLKQDKEPPASVETRGPALELGGPEDPIGTFGSLLQDTLLPVISPPLSWVGILTGFLLLACIGWLVSTWLEW